MIHFTRTHLDSAVLSLLANVPENRRATQRTRSTMSWGRMLLDQPRAELLDISVLCALFAIAYFVVAGLRHHVFHSGAMDMAFFDQLVYLISRGQTPTSARINEDLPEPLGPITPRPWPAVSANVTSWMIGL